MNKDDQDNVKKWLSDDYIPIATKKDDSEYPTLYPINKPIWRPESEIYEYQWNPINDSRHLRCGRIFWQWWNCCSSRGQTKNYYRTGRLYTCSKEWSELHTCVKCWLLSKAKPDVANKLLHEKSKQEYLEPDEHIWEMRTSPPAPWNKRHKNNQDDPFKPRRNN